LDESLKIKKGVQKYLLKEILYDYIPKKIMDRPKWGFSIPLQNWLQRDLKYLIDNYLSKTVIENYNIVHFSKVQLLVDKFNQGSIYLYNRLWILILLHKWLEDND